MAREPDRYAAALFNSIVGRKDVYALQNPDRSYVPVREPLTLEVLRGHISGTRTVGSYLVTPHGNARCGIYDFDEMSPMVREYLVFLYKWFLHWGIRLGIEFSGRQGYHAWLITRNWVPASKLIALLRLPLSILKRDKGMSPTAEVFPKQATISDLGNLIKLPWGIHRHSGNRTAFLDESFNPLPDWGLSYVEQLPPIEEGLIDEILAEYPDKQAKSATNRRAHAKEEIVAMLTKPAAVGQRRPTLIALAGYLRFRGITEDVAIALLLPWAEKRFVEPLPPQEIERHIRGIYRRYGTRTLGIDEAQLVQEIPNAIEELWK